MHKVWFGRMLALTELAPSPSKPTLPKRRLQRVPRQDTTTCTGRHADAASGAEGPGSSENPVLWPNDAYMPWPRTAVQCPSCCVQICTFVCVGGGGMWTRPLLQCRTVSSRSTKAPYSRRSFFRSVSGRPAFFDRDASFIQTFHPDWLSLTQVSTQHMSLPLIGLVVVLTYCVVSLLVLRLVFGWTFVDGCYFCIVMLSTVGYGDVVPMTSAEKLFVSLSAFVAVSMLAAALGYVAGGCMGFVACASSVGGRRCHGYQCAACPAAVAEGLGRQ